MSSSLVEGPWGAVVVIGKGIYEHVTALEQLETLVNWKRAKQAKLQFMRLGHVEDWADH
jgi:hypothetical protein